VARGLKIAVCTNRPPASVNESVTALTGQLRRDDSAVLVASGAAAADAGAYEEAVGWPVLAEPREGLARARNRALAWCDEEDVLAFVDDDAIVDQGWRDALARRWEEAPAEVACIGGPIRPRWPSEPPDWISPPLLPALTLLDLGTEPLELDPEETAVYGANISFRAGPLREAGGFDPALGHSGTRVFFAEEDEAQRALARLGYRILYAPDAAVLHAIPPERLTRSSFLRRRFAYGAALGRRGGRRRTVALRWAVTSGLGALAATLTGRETLAMERAVRAAENAGVLLGRS
jgi:GT2 family glycosyltransferase